MTEKLFSQWETGKNQRAIKCSGCRSNNFSGWIHFKLWIQNTQGNTKLFLVCFSSLFHNLQAACHSPHPLCVQMSHVWALRKGSSAKFSAHLSHWMILAVVQQRDFSLANIVASIGPTFPVIIQRVCPFSFVFYRQMLISIGGLVSFVHRHTKEPPNRHTWKDDVHIILLFHYLILCLHSALWHNPAKSRAASDSDPALSKSKFLLKTSLVSEFPF